MEANKILFRCSGLGKIVAGEREKPNEIAKGVQTNLIDITTSFVYNRREEISSKYLEKGNVREEDAITLLSRINKKFYKKNSEKLSNEYIKGECDIYLGKSILEAEETHDTKCSWSIFTFKRTVKLDLDYKWQGVGYMWLTGSKQHSVHHCLVNGTVEQIMGEKKKLAYKMNLIDPDTDPTYVEKCKEIERNHIFDFGEFEKENPHFEFHYKKEDWNFDIPIHKRIKSFAFERNESEIESLKERIVKCRNWIQAELLEKGF